MTHLN